MPGTHVAPGVEKINREGGSCQVLKMMESHDKTTPLQGDHHLKTGLLEPFTGLGAITPILRCQKTASSRFRSVLHNEEHRTALSGLGVMRIAAVQDDATITGFSGCWRAAPGMVIREWFVLMQGNMRILGTKEGHHTMPIFVPGSK